MIAAFAWLLYFALIAILISGLVRFVRWFFGPSDAEYWRRWWVEWEARHSGRRFRG